MEPFEKLSFFIHYFIVHICPLIVTWLVQLYYIDAIHLILLPTILHHKPSSEPIVFISVLCIVMLYLSKGHLSFSDIWSEGASKPSLNTQNSLPSRLLICSRSFVNLQSGVITCLEPCLLSSYLSIQIVWLKVSRAISVAKKASICRGESSTVPANWLIVSSVLSEYPINSQNLVSTSSVKI